MYIKTSSK